MEFSSCSTGPHAGGWQLDSEVGLLRCLAGTNGTEGFWQFASCPPRMSTQALACREGGAGRLRARGREDVEEKMKKMRKFFQTLLSFLPYLAAPTCIAYACCSDFSFCSARESA
eukprot:766640-Hanusia_phi.AAC.8